MKAIGVYVFRCILCHMGVGTGKHRRCKGGNNVRVSIYGRKTAGDRERLE